MLQAILNAIRAVLNGIFTILKNVVLWVWGWVWGKFLAILATLGIPTQYLTFAGITDLLTESGLMPYVQMANDWLPISEALIAFGIYFAFYLAVIPIKLVLRRIPGMSTGN